MFNSSWSRCWKLLGGNSLGEQLKYEVLQAYSEDHRKYHTLQHLEECLLLFNEYANCAQHPAVVEMALWFHDVIYNVKRHDNEEKSANYAFEKLSSAGVHDKYCSRIFDLIMVSKHNKVPECSDQQLLVDIDLAILGAEPQRFKEYEHQVREEYAYVSECVYKENRKKLLLSFLDRQKIYTNTSFQERFEARARENIVRSISDLS